MPTSRPRSSTPMSTASISAACTRATTPAPDLAAARARRRATLSAQECGDRRRVGIAQSEIRHFLRRRILDLLEHVLPREPPAAELRSDREMIVVVAEIRIRVTDRA